jgi:predicted kinase
MAVLVLMVGGSGSGKSTDALKYSKEKGYVYLSSDALRGIIGTDEGDQSVSGIVFATMRTITEFLLKTEQSVVIDATNLFTKSRKDFVAIGRKYNTKVIARLVMTPIEECKRRNALRNRKVPDEIIDQQFSKLQWPIEGVEVDEIEIVK